jgi:hypothetical protein
MKSAELAITHNNYAASLITSAKNYIDAISHLKEALFALKTMDDLPLLQVCGDSLEIGFNDCMSKRLIVCDDRMDFMYRDAIVIPTNLGQRINHVPVRTMMSCIVIFNLALAHHLSAVDATVDDVKSTLIKALRLYEMAVNVKRSELTKNDAMFILAVTNNLGLLHRQLDNETVATQCFETVLATLMYLADHKEGNLLPLDGFFINTSFLVSKTSVAPAA